MTVPYYIYSKQLRNITAEPILPKETVAREVAWHKVLNLLKARPEQRWDSDKNMRVDHMFKSWNSHHLHYNKHFRTTCICFFAFFLSTSWQVLSLCTRFLMWLLGLVWTAGAEAVVYSRLDLLEKRELWHRSRSLPLTFSPTLFLYTKQHSAQWHTKHQKCQKSCWCLSLFHLFSVFWEHWFLHVQTQHIELIKLTCMHAQTQFIKQFRCDG